MRNRRVRRGRLAKLAGLLAAGMVAGLFPGAGAVATSHGFITDRINISNGGAQANGNSVIPRIAISADGRFVAFQSPATNLIPDDINGAEDIFVRDRQGDLTELISVASTGAQVDNSSFFPAISADGRYVAFSSTSTNLVPGKTNFGVEDVYVHDRLTHTTERVSLSSSGVESNGDSRFPVISGDGRYVAFHTEASNLVPGDTNGKTDILVHDRVAARTTRVSLASDGNEGNGHSWPAAIAADGRTVAFASWATNLVPGDTNGKADHFVVDWGAAPDMGALETQVTVTPPPNGDGWHKGDVTVTLAATGLGKPALHVRLNGGEEMVFPSGTATLMISPAGNHVVEYYATDLLGQVEPLHSWPCTSTSTRPP